MDHIINNIQLSQNLMCVKNIKNILSMVRFLKYVVMLIFFNGSCSLRLQPSLKPNFVNFLKWTINKCLKSTH